MNTKSLTVHAIALLSLLLLLVAAMSPLVAQTTDITGLLDNPEAALNFDYCHWRFKDNGSESQLPDLEAIMDDKSDSSAAQKLAASQVLAGTRIALAAKKQKACGRIFEEAKAKHEAALERSVEAMRGRAFMLYDEKTGDRRDPEDAGATVGTRSGCPPCLHRICHRRSRGRAVLEETAGSSGGLECR